MSIVKSSLIIIFDPPFYKAVFERHFASTYEVPKITLLYALVVQHWNKISFFQQKSSELAYFQRKISPKRLQQVAKKMRIQELILIS